MIKQLVAGTAVVASLAVGGVAVAGAVSPEQSAKRPGATAQQHQHAGIGRRVLRHAAAVAADTIGIDVATLRSEVATQGSIAAVATAHGSSGQAVIDALVADGQAAIAKARDAGKISAERASRLESHLTTRVTAFVNDTKQVLQRLRQGWKRHQQRRPIGSQAQGRGAMQA